jgi:DNA polymerase-3 subunit delta'
MAHRLATNVQARERRRRTLELALGIRSVSGAVLAAAELVAVANDDAKAYTEENDAEERDKALRSLGIEPGAAVPPGLRAQLKALDDDQKRRATRSLRDGIDRILVDLMSLYRDILLLQLGVATEPVNLAIYAQLEQAAALTTPSRTLETLDAIATARERIEGNVTPALALEAMLVSAVRDSAARERSTR